MPYKENGPVAPQPQKMFYGQVPTTKFIPLAMCPKVEVISGPSMEELEACLEFLSATHLAKAEDYKSPGKDYTSLVNALNGSGLWNATEMLSFTFKITNITRITTHQLVRARIGVRFSQQSTGDVDMRHCDIILPEPYLRKPGLASKYIDSMLTFKELYCDLLDSGVPIHEVRYVIPHSAVTLIYMNANLAAILGLYTKRSCTMTQVWEMVQLARRMKEAVCEKAPFLKEVFVDLCKAGKCWFQKAKFAGKNTPLFTPDKEHDTFDWGPGSWIYGTHEEESCPSELKYEPFTYTGRELTDGALPINLPF